MKTSVTIAYVRDDSTGGISTWLEEYPSCVAQCKSLEEAKVILNSQLKNLLTMQITQLDRGLVIYTGKDLTEKYAEAAKIQEKLMKDDEAIHAKDVSENKDKKGKVPAKSRKMHDKV